jgi:LytS/YehU family sensor histidine kinase
MIFVPLALAFGFKQPVLPFGRLVQETFRDSLAMSMAIYGVVVTVYHAIEYYRAYRDREVAAAQLETQLAHAQLDVLRMQLHPHFLFNTLHGISSLMAKDVHGARRMITRLSDLLRLSLENDGVQEVTLGEELEFLNHYIELQRMRFQDRLTVTIEIDADARLVMVPKLLLQPLVENAIRHGISRHARPGFIEITGRVEAGSLRLTIADNGPGIVRRDGEPLREGVGIGNTRARLRQLYGDAQSLTLVNGEREGLTVGIALPARAARHIIHQIEEP